jgi:DNA topoisomerase IB
MSIIYRNRINKTFVYSTNKTRGSNKTVVTNKTILDKIKKYRIPPAWIKVEITLNKSLIAIGFDSVGRKQYVYSTDYI